MKHNQEAQRESIHPSEKSMSAHLHSAGVLDACEVVVKVDSLLSVISQRDRSSRTHAISRQACQLGRKDAR